ncbi:hypothetical protein K493DRAFT_69709 [Basidiobolus meristosporus CBS 931.73]|uniref:SS18 N-terminal domain-containing protein n=1 Tax=Basidiobolus meristosporus CBS 931.73 TaxID=1314790 RepID=A0A1Y1YZH1_9FUNG|nr:hypothetical protein K493DRAFT_69709 [Basidiobolus meristosporus CBS 931.73]|eukprot:ORY03438.1 hypothetical protein K493DRAFT_69709 [Basidiobolus meristosporus CBS 931.73]
MEPEQQEYQPSLLPEFSARNVQMVLDINSELIRVCVDFQNKGWVNDPEFAIYQSRLQSNLTYLATVADHFLKPQQTNRPVPSAPDLSPFPTPRTSSAQRLNGLLTKAIEAFNSKLANTEADMLERSRGLNSIYGGTGNPNDPQSRVMDVPKAQKDDGHSGTSTRVFQLQPLPAVQIARWSPSAPRGSKQRLAASAV